MGPDRDTPDRLAGGAPPDLHRPAGHLLRVGGGTAGAGGGRRAAPGVRRRPLARRVLRPGRGRGAVVRGRPDAGGPAGRGDAAGRRRPAPLGDLGAPAGGGGGRGGRGWGPPGVGGASLSPLMPPGVGAFGPARAAAPPADPATRRVATPPAEVATSAA